MSLKKLLKEKLPILTIIVFLLVFCLITIFLNSCSNQNQSSSDGKLNITATTTLLTDLAKEIGGDQVNITGLMGPGIDPHLYQASAGDVTKLQEADIVIYNGMHLEGKMGDVFASLREQGRNIICIEDGIDSSNLLEDEENPGFYDPHIWFDVSIWKEAAEYVSSQLSSIDPDSVKSYAENLENYLIELDELEEYIRNRVDEVPKNQQVLVTAHDAFGYFGNAYGFDVIGLQGISTAAEAGTADVSNLAEFITANQIKAIFVESSVPPKNIEALQAAVVARGFEVEIGGQLYSDSLGDESSGQDTYIQTFRTNIDTIVDGLK